MIKDKVQAESLKTGTNTHYIYMDIIRIFAAYLVIFTHTGDVGSKLYVYGDYDRIHKFIYRIADVLRCVNVPLFFMVSGALLLAKTESYKELFKKRIARYLIVLIVMSYFYFTVYYENPWYDFALFARKLCTEYVLGSYWYLYAYLGYLLVLPFLRKMVRTMEKKDFQYFMILGILFKGILDVGTGLCGWTGRILISFYFANDAVFYPIMGFYFSNLISKPEEISKKTKANLVAGGLASLACVFATVFMMHWEACRIEEYKETYLMSFTVIPTLFVFMLIKCMCLKVNISGIAERVIRFIADNTFGVYLFSIYTQIRLLCVYRFFNEKTGGHLPLLSSYAYVFIVMMVEVVIVAILRKIPIIRKFI